MHHSALMSQIPINPIPELDMCSVIPITSYSIPGTNASSLQWRHNEPYGVSNHQNLDYLLNRVFRRRSKKTPKLRVTGLCEGNQPVTGEFPAQRSSNAENVSIWWRHHYLPFEHFRPFLVFAKPSLHFWHLFPFDLHCRQFSTSHAGNKGATEGPLLHSNSFPRRI